MNILQYENIDQSLRQIVAIMKQKIGMEESSLLLNFIIYFSKYLIMSKDQTDSHLRYGQGIIIKGYKPQKDPNEGVMTVRGFADTLANYQTFSDILYFKNYRNGIFQFLPAGNFEINDQLQKLKTQADEADKQNQEFKKTIETLSARSISEKVQFELSIKRNKKATIKFGDYIMLRHIDSDTYLSGTIRPSDGSNGAFSVEVSPRLSTSLIFQILPYRSFENQPMQIPFSSPVLIKNIYNNGFLTFEKLGKILQKNPDDQCMKKVATSSDESYQIPVKTVSQDSSVYQVVTHFIDLSQESKYPMPWQFQLHFKEVQNDSLIQHDIVYLKHTDNNGILSAVGKQIVLKESKQEQVSEGLKFYESLWEIQKHGEGSHSYILRHLMSGMTLGVNKSEDEEQIPLNATLVDISGGPEKSKLGVVELYLAKKDEKQINSSSFIYLRSGNYNLDISDQDYELAEQNGLCESKISQNSSENIIDLKRMKKLMKNEIEYNIKKLSFNVDLPINCFTIQQIEEDLKKELLFALSFHSTIINLREDLKWGATDAMKKVTYLRMMRVTQKIKQINDFLKQCQGDCSQKEYKQPVTKRQLICKDLGLSELLFELLFYIRENIKQQIFKQKVNEREKFNEMHETIYEVIINLIKNNRIFKVHVSKWIMFIFEDFVQVGLPIHYQALMQLLKDNDFFLQNFVNSKLIVYLLQSMKKERGRKSFTEKRYIDVLRSFCKVGDKIYSGNQGLILKYFIEKLELADDQLYQIKFYRRAESIYCRVALDKKNVTEINFENLKSTCLETDQNEESRYPNSWDYYVAYLNLLADLTQGRNRSVQKYAAKEFPLQLLAQLFKHERIYQLQVPVIKIIHYLYSENEKFYPIDKENRIVLYQAIQKSDLNEINHFICSEPPCEEMKKVLLILMEKLSNAGPIMPKLPDKSSEENTKIYSDNQILYQLLKLTHQTLNLGFWTQRSQLKDIYKNILNILMKHPEISYSQSVKICKQNMLMISCKLECLSIIDLIISQDLNTNIKICHKVFKNFDMERNDVRKNPLSLISKAQSNESGPQFMGKLQQQFSSLELTVDSNIYHQLVELSNYQNPDLTSKSLSVMEKILNFNKYRILKFWLSIYVCEEKYVYFAKFLTNLQNKFYLLEDPNTTKINTESQKQNYYNVYIPLQKSYQIDRDNSLMQDLYIITELMKNENSLQRVQEIPTLDSLHLYDKLGTQCLINFTNCRKSSNLTKQKILYASNIHIKVLSYIKNCSEFPEEELAIKLLHLCYFFIVSLTENHQQIKSQICKYLPIFLKHLEKNVGAIDLLRQLYDNNKNMLYNQAEIYPLIRIICDLIQKEGNLLYKSKILDFFRYLIYLNNKCLGNNQIHILKIIQDDDYSSILKQINVELVQKLSKQYSEMNDFGRFQSGKVKCDGQLIYTSSYLQIISSLIDNKNKVNIGKLNKRFPFQLLINCIGVSRDCWILKRNLRAILNRMYYFSSNINVYISLIISKELPYIIEDLDIFLKEKNRKEDQVMRLENIMYENPVRFSYLESHFYLNLEEVFFSLFYIFISEDLCSQFLSILKSQSQPNDLCSNLIKINERLGAIRNYFKKVKNVGRFSMIKYLQSKVNKILDQLPIQMFEPGLAGLVRSKKLQQREKSKGFILEKIMSGQINQFYEHNSEEYKSDLPLTYRTSNKSVQVKNKRQKDRNRLKGKLKEIFSRKKNTFEDKDEQINDKKEKIISALKMSKQVSEKLTKSFQDLFLQCYKTQGSNKQQSLEEFLTYIQILIKINEEDDSILSENLKIFVLRKLISLYYEANEHQTEKEIDQWEAEDWENNQGSIQKLQNRLMSIGIGSFITSLIKGNICQNIELANQTLLCSIAYMLGGNKQAQNNIRQQLNKDQDNKLLINIKRLINKLGSLIRKNIEQQRMAVKADSDQMHNFQFSPNHIDNYDFYDVSQKYATRKNVAQPHYDDQILFYQECIVTYRRTFKFLQLLCENNNIHNKNFIREQEEVAQSIDFIQIATKELRNLFQVVNVSIAEVPIFIMDFLLEVTQIPVKQNQDALIKSSFFEDICLLANTMCKQQKMKEAQFESKQDLGEIYQKCVQIILSNLQGNSEQYFLNLDRKLDPYFLINMVKQKLKNLSITNASELKQYIEKITEPKDNAGKLEAPTDFDDKIIQVLEIITIFLKLRDVVGEKSKIFNAYIKQKQDNKAQGPDFRQLLETLEQYLLKIQIADENKNKINVYFPNHPFFNSMSGGLKDFVMSQVKRETHRQKIVSLLGYVKDVRHKIAQSYNFQKCQNISEDLMNSYYKASSNIALFICLYMFLFYNVYVQYGVAEFTSSWLVVIVRFLLSLLQFKYSVLYVFTWFKLNTWIKPESKPYENAKNVEIGTQLLNFALLSSKNLPEEIKQQPQQQKFLTKIILKVKQKYQRTAEVFPFLNTLFQQFTKFKQSIFPSDPDQPKVSDSPQFYFYAAYVVISAIAAFLYPKLIFIFIVQRVCSIDQLGDIFQAIGSAAKSLFYVSVMGVVFVLVFNLTTFSNYVKDVYGETQDLNQMCSNPISCILALYVSGAIGQTMDKFEITRFVYDLIYSIFFGLLFGNIISGLILDAFEELRSSSEELQDDKENFCYICNISRERLEKNGEKFEDHISMKHHLWNYIFYIICLENKNETDYTGLQYYISQKYRLPDEDMDVSWFPDAQDSAFEKQDFINQLNAGLDSTEEERASEYQSLKEKISQFNQQFGATLQQ